jgi:hypothetical protein
MYTSFNENWLDANKLIRTGQRILAFGSGVSWKIKGVKLGMTWGMKVSRVAFALGLIAVLALASGANWIDELCSLGW